MAARSIGFIINEQKTKFMQISNRPVAKDILEIGEYKFQIVHEFKYLGTIITDDNDINKEIRSRILQANRCYYAL